MLCVRGSEVGLHVSVNGVTGHLDNLGYHPRPHYLALADTVSHTAIGILMRNFFFAPIVITSLIIA